MLPFLLALTLIPAPQAPASQAPANTAQAPAPDPKLVALLSTAVRALDTGKGLYLVGSVDEKKAAEEPDSESGGMKIMIGGAGEDAGDPYKGSIEVLCTEKKELLVASLGGLPEVVVFDDGSARLVRTTIADGPVSSKRMVDDLGSLLDLGRLASQVDKCTQLKAWDPGADGSRSFECELSPRSIQSADQGMHAMMAPKVLSVHARFDLDPKGAVVSFEFDVTRSDPTAGFRRHARENAGPGAGSGERIVQLGGGMPKNDEPGPTAIYKLRTSAEVPSAHAREALFALRKLAEKK